MAGSTAGSGIRVKGVHYEVPVADLERAIASYTRVFAKGPEYRMENEAGYGIAPGISLNLVTSRKEPVRSLWIAVDGIRPLFRRFAEEGILVKQEPEDAGYATVGAIEDPFGNIIHFAE